MINLFYAYSGINFEESMRYREKLDDYFSLDEQAEYRRFKVAKRQHEWISSRIIIKKMIMRIINKEKLNFPDIRIQKESTGQPFIYIEGQGRLVGKFSLSHSNGFVFCGYSQEPEFNFGLDLEKVETRKLEFIQDYFTQLEIQHYHLLDDNLKNEYTTLIWSAKEALLKTISKGLSMDTRKVEIIPALDETKMLGWKSCSVNFHSLSGANYIVYWQELDGFIRTVCVPVGFPVQMNEISME